MASVEMGPATEAEVGAFHFAKGEHVVLRLPDGRTVRLHFLAFGTNRDSTSSVRVGIEAPMEVCIYREEAAARYAPPQEAPK